MSDATAAPTSTPTSGSAGRYGTFAVWSAVTPLILIALGSAGVFWARTDDVAATCGGARMAPTDSCDQVRNGVAIGTKTYEEMLALAIEQNQMLMVAAAIMAVVGVLYGALAVVRWHQDSLLRAKMLDTSRTPLATYGFRPKVSLGSGLLGAGLLGVCTLGVVNGLAEDNKLYLGVGGVMGLFALLMLWTGKPDNGTMLQIFDDGVRVACGTLREAPWSEISYVIHPAQGAAEHLVRVGGRDFNLAGFEDPKPWQDFAQDRTLKEKFPIAMAAIERGETVKFGEVAVNNEGVKAPIYKIIPWSEGPTIKLEKGEVSIDRTPAAFLGSLINLGSLPDYLLFVTVVTAMKERHAN